MKTFCTLLVAFIFYANAIGQSDPGCSDFTVQSITLSPLISQMNVNVKNNCTNCTSGLNGCVYWEMMVIRTVAPFDTLASSNCSCLQTPNNNSLKSYSFLSTATVLPPLNELRVSFMCGPTVGCDSITASTALSLQEIQNTAPLFIVPNPIKDQVLVKAQSGIALNLEVLDIQGKICMQQSIDEVQKILNFSILENGFYFIRVKDKNGKILKQFKITKA